MFKEQCWFLYGIRIGKYYIGYREYHSEGSFASVGFDWRKAKNKLHLGWAHTHPGGEPYPSSTDKRTMSGWVIGSGKPLICDIASDGKNRTWLYGKKNPCDRRSSDIIKCNMKINYYGSLFLGEVYKHGKIMVDEYAKK